MFFQGPFWIAIFLSVGAASLFGFLAVAAWSEARRQERESYYKNDMLKKLAEIPGVTCTKPEGAFYVYPNISAFLGKGGIQTATQLASRLLHEAHVVTVPGEAFDFVIDPQDALGTRHVRQS